MTPDKKIYNALKRSEVHRKTKREKAQAKLKLRLEVSVSIYLSKEERGKVVREY